MLVVDAFERTAMIGLALDATASDLAYRPGFLPLVARLSRAMSRPGSMPDQALAPGEAPAMPVGVRDGEIELVLPSGAVVSRAIDAGVVSLDDLDAAGPYLARLPRPDGPLGLSPRSPFVVAPPAEESDLSPAELPAALTGEGEDGAGPALAERPLGRWLFLGLGLLAIAEGFARTRKPGRAPLRAAA